MTRKLMTVTVDATHYGSRGGFLARSGVHSCESIDRDFAIRGVAEMAAGDGDCSPAIPVFVGHCLLGELGDIVEPGWICDGEPL